MKDLRVGKVVSKSSSASSSKGSVDKSKGSDKHTPSSLVVGMVKKSSSSGLKLTQSKASSKGKNSSDKTASKDGKTEDIDDLFSVLKQTKKARKEAAEEEARQAEKERQAEKSAPRIIGLANDYQSSFYSSSRSSADKKSALVSGKKIRWLINPAPRNLIPSDIKFIKFIFMSPIQAICSFLANWRRLSSELTPSLATLCTRPTCLA